LKLLIGGSKSKIFHLKEFGEALSNFGIEYKLVNDVEIYSGFPSKKIPRNFQTLSKFHKLIDELKPDAVFYDNQLHFGLAVLKSKIPLFMHLRGDYWSEMKWARETIYKMPHQIFAAWWKMNMGEKCFRNSTMILPICKYLEDIVRKRYPKQDVRTLYQGITPSHWYHVEGIKLKHPCVGLLQGAVIWGKTREMLTLTKVLSAMPNVTFYWVGDGQYLDKILPILNKYENFEWLGPLEYPDKVREYLSEIDVYALVSGIDMSPLTLEEAQLMKKPVVATRVGGIPELMKDGETGFLVEKGDYKGWINKLSVLLNDDKKARKMGDSGRKFVEQNFSWDIIAKNFVSFLKNNLN